MAVEKSGKLEVMMARMIKPGEKFPLSKNKML
jgi:hypothetical protein